MSTKGGIQKVAISIEAVRLDVESLKVDISGARTAIDKQDGMLTQGLLNADLGKKIIKRIKDLGKAFSLIHDVGLANSSAHGAQISMLDRLLSQSAINDRRVNQQEDEIGRQNSDFGETVNPNNACTSIRLEESDLEVIKKFRKALQESADGLKQVQAHKAAVGENFTSTMEKETRLSRLKQLAMFLASSCVGGLVAAMATKDWNRAERVVDWRQEWVQINVHAERVNRRGEWTEGKIAKDSQVSHFAATPSRVIAPLPLHKFMCSGELNLNRLQLGHTSIAGNEQKVFFVQRPAKTRNVAITCLLDEPA
jgi:hypothetical protein